MRKGKEIFLLILGGIGWLMYGVALMLGGAMDDSFGVWLMYGVALMLGGAMDDSFGVWLCVVSLVLGIGLFYFGLDKLLEPKRW